MEQADKNNTKDQGCLVDWSWLQGRKIAKVWSDLQNIIFTFEDGQTFKVQAAMYQGDPFLAFIPYKDPRQK